MGLTIAHAHCRVCDGRGYRIVPREIGPLGNIIVKRTDCATCNGTGAVDA